MEFKYKGLEGTLEKLTVTEEELERQLRRLDGMDNSEFSPEELREGVRESLQGLYDSQAEEELLDRLIRQAADTLDYTPSEEEVTKGAQMQLEVLKSQLAQRELTLEAYCSFMGSKEEELLEDLRTDAAQMLKIQAAIERIAELEDIRAEEAEVQACIRDICRENHLSGEELQSLYDESFAKAVENSVVSRKVLDFVRKSAIVTEITK